MQCYTELLPPTGVTHALTIPFLSPSANNLIIAKTSLLQIFNVVNVDVKSGNDQRRISNASSDHQQAKLVLVAEHVLPGIITDLARVKLMESKSGGDALIVSTRNAKLSLVEWDPEAHNLSTISIHYYENEDANLNPWVPDITRCPTHLTVDSNYRCAVLHYCLNRIAVLPFRQPGDDLVMDDYDTEFGADNDSERREGEMRGEGGGEEGATTEKQKQDESTTTQTLYLPSFVLPLPALDPSLVHPRCLEFLNEYREPTFGVLYSQLSPSNNMSVERKDVMVYSIVTLDLEQHASTILVTVSKLPSDLYQIIPLPLPVGGALLLGANEVIHIDQAGKTNAVGINEFCRLASSFSMADQSALGMRLENCQFEHLGTHNGDMLMMLADGRTAILSFKLDGRSVSGMSIRVVSSAAGGELLSLAPTCTANVGNNVLFLGSEETDSLLVGFSKPQTKQKTKVDEDRDISDVSDKDEDEDEDMYEDDLYSSSPKDNANANGETVSDEATGEPYVFRELDRLQSLGPMIDITLGKPFKRDEKVDKSSVPLPELELLASQGRNGSGALTVLRQKLDPEVDDTLEVQGAQAAWAVHVKDSKNTETQSSQDYAQYLILAISHDEGEQTLVHEIGESAPKALKAPEFNPNHEKTVDIGTVADGRRIVQVLGSEVRSYDNALELSQIYPVFDEDTSEERHAISVTFSDPYIAIIRDDQSLLLLQADNSGDLDEIPLEGQLVEHKWLSASLYRDKGEFFIPKITEHQTNTFMVLLGTEGQVIIFNLPEIEKPTCIIDGLDLLPPSLPFTTPVRRTNLREELGELVVANLGDQTSHAPYFILLTALGDLVIYEPYHAPSNASGAPYSIETLRLQKLSNQSLYDFFGTSQSLKPSSSNPPLRVLENVGGYKTVFIPGLAPRFIIKTATSVPHIVGLRGGHVRSLGEYHTSKCERGLIYMDDTEKGLVRMCHISSDINLETSWATRRIQLNEEIVSICYSPAQDVYALGTTQTVGFKLPDDDEIHPEWQNEVLSFFPRMRTGSVQLLEPEQWSLIDEFMLENPAERIMCVKCISMEVSELTGERKEMVVVGTAITKGEDVPARGCIYVFNVINVVPDPERPVRSRRLKLFAKEKVKGVVTSISTVGDQGFIIVAQGQKCMVRGLKEDGSLLPVAFMDMQCYVSTLKELRGTGLCIMADALRGLWFAGYSEEPYKLSLFSKDTDNLQVLHADFLPDGKRLYILASDDNCNLHIFQYDPEDPTSSNGDRLLHRSSFQTGHLTSTITLLPRAIYQPSTHDGEGGTDAMDIDSSSPNKSAAYQVLVTSTSGQMAVVTPLTEETYRRLSAIQSHLTTTQEHPCGLNPRAFRAVQSDVTGGRGMVDGSLLRRYLDLAPQRKMEMATRAGADLWEIRTDLEVIGCTGLAYL